MRVSASCWCHHLVVQRGTSAEAADMHAVLSTQACEAGGASKQNYAPNGDKMPLTECSLLARARTSSARSCSFIS